MKRVLLLVIAIFSFAFTFSSCGPKCKKCHMDLMGVKTPEQEMCGDQLEQAKKTTGMICE